MTQAVFIGGSRHISQLPDEIKARLDNIVRKGYRVLVGDADGVDKAVQHYLNALGYKNVTVFSSGGKTRNNVGNWQLQSVAVPKGTKGFDFYAAKDREMAKQADFGLMVWDSKSPGTILNALRLVSHGKKTRVFNARSRAAFEVRSTDEWKNLVQTHSESLLSDLKKRVTDADKIDIQFDIPKEEEAVKRMKKNRARSDLSSSEHVKIFNAALSEANTKALEEAIMGLPNADKTGDAADLVSKVSKVIELLSEAGMQLSVKKKPKKKAIKKTKISVESELSLPL